MMGGGGVLSARTGWRWVTGGGGGRFPGFTDR